MLKKGILVMERLTIVRRSITKEQIGRNIK